MIHAIKEINLPNYATLSEATVTLNDMGDRTITTRVKIGHGIIPDFSFDWEIEFMGERYVHSARKPQAVKDNKSKDMLIDMTFRHKAVVELQRYFFVDVVSIEAGTFVADKFVTPLGLTLRGFINLFNNVLDYWLGGKIKAELNPAWQDSATPTYFNISYTHIWDVLQKVYEIYAVRWTIENGEAPDTYVIKFGYDAPEATHIFEYGYKGGLLKIERQVQDTDICNILLGRGGDKNLPHRYFKVEDGGGGGSTGAAETKSVSGLVFSIGSLKPDERRDCEADSKSYNISFTVPDGKTGTLLFQGAEVSGRKGTGDLFSYKFFGEGEDMVDIKNNEIRVYRMASSIRNPSSETREEVNASAIPPGTYYYTWSFRVTNSFIEEEITDMTAVLESLSLIVSEGLSNSQGGSFFAADPDAIPELADITFTELRSAEFRSYVQGWKAKNYKGTVTREEAYVQWAYDKGYTDERFDPVEYVKDDGSIRKYGEMWGALDNNDDIYPSIQGSGFDDVIDVEEITSDDIEEDDRNAEDKTLAGFSVTIGTMAEGARMVFEWKGIFDTFSIPDGKKGTVLSHNPEISGRSNGESCSLTIEDSSIKVYDSNTGEEVNATAIPPGTYYYTWSLTVVNPFGEKKVEDVVATLHSFGLTISDGVSDYNSNVFHIWIRNIWGTSKNAGEKDEDYVNRVWLPILGTDGENASVSFSTGFLSVSDYDFMIVKGGVAFDDSRVNADGENSHWRLTLQKSDAEFEATGLLIPNTKINARSGDRFFFTGIELPHQYVVWAEQRLHDWKRDNLVTMSDIKPVWAVSVDKVRANSFVPEDVLLLVEQLSVGSRIRLMNEQLMTDDDEKPYVLLYITSVTYKWAEPTENSPYIYPDVEIVLSDKVAAVSNPVEMLSNEVSELRAQVGSVSNIEQVVRAVGDRIYLRKDGIPDVEYGSVTFYESNEYRAREWFREGMIIGPAGYVGGITGFGGKVDMYANAELESLTLRRFLEVPELRYNKIEMYVGNQWRAPGGGLIDKVVPDYDESGNEKETGTIYLHLEDGEIGEVSMDDICMGIFHDAITPDNNASESSDDSRGNFSFSGFSTCYFRITEVNAEGGNASFRYVLRGVSDTWNSSYHPKEAMTFVCYGNFTNIDRQTSRYSTLTYERFLKGVNDWEFTAENIAAQFGDLSNLSVYGLDMKGYSAFLNNIYMTGTVEQLNLPPLRMEIDTRGDQFLAWGESLTCTCKVFRGWDEMTEHVTKWSVTRESGDSASDASWLLKDKVKNFAGTLVLSYTEEDNDLGMNALVPSVLFHFKAEWDDGEPQEADMTLEI